MKPSPEIFQTLIERSGLRGEQILYSDDKEENIR
jgi:FMN phosphatase YigB (HAD superfamily)